MADRSVQHDTISVERVFDAPLAEVYAAWADPERWDLPGADSWGGYEGHDFHVLGGAVRRRA